MSKSQDAASNARSHQINIDPNKRNVPINLMDQLNDVLNQILQRLKNLEDYTKLLEDKLEIATSEDHLDLALDKLLSKRGITFGKKK